MDFCQDCSDYIPGARNGPALGLTCFTYTYIGKHFKKKSSCLKLQSLGLWYLVCSIAYRSFDMSVQIIPLGWKEAQPTGVGDVVTCFTQSKKPLAMIRPRTIKLIGRMDLKSRWPLSQRSRSPWPLLPKKILILQCLWLGPSNLVEMLVLTSRWSLEQRSRSPGPLVLKTWWQRLGIGPSNLEGMLVLTSTGRWHWGQRSWSRSPWPLVLKA